MSHIFFPTFPLLPSFGLLLIHIVHLRLEPDSGTTNLSTASFRLANFPALTAFQGHLFLGIKPFFFFSSPKGIDMATLSGLLPGKECPCSSFITTTAIGTFAVCLSILAAVPETEQSFQMQGIPFG